MHEVLVNRLGGLSLPRKSVVRLTDRPDMTLDAYRGHKTTMQQQPRERERGNLILSKLCDSVLCEILSHIRRHNETSADVWFYFFFFFFFFFFFLIYLFISDTNTKI